MGGSVMKYYIERDKNNKVVTKGTVNGDVDIKLPLIEVTEEEFNLIEQYVPPAEVQPREPTLEERLVIAEDAINFLLGL
jgi:hypothetical protein